MSEDALVPCPWCGSRVEVFPVYVQDIDFEYRQYRASCSNAVCLAMGPWCRNERDAADMWNKGVRRGA